LIEKQAAQAILALAYALDQDLGRMDTVISHIADEATRERYSKALGDLIGAIARDFISPITREYPELDKDKRA